MTIKGASERPPKVDLSIKFLYMVVCIGMVRAVMTVMRHVDVRSPNLLILTKLFIYLGSLFLIYQLGRGKNWARLSLSGLFAVNIPLTILPAFESISHNPIHTLLGFLQLALYILALVFLFQKNSSNWFSTGKVSHIIKTD